MTSVLSVLHRVTWGDALVLKVHRSRVGLNPLVEAIRAAVGRHIGSRNTFAKLYDVVDVGELDETDRYRAWLLLTALDCEPEDWGVDQSCLPPTLDVQRIQTALQGLVRHQGLEPRTRWFGRLSDDGSFVPFVGPGRVPAPRSPIGRAGDIDLDHPLIADYGRHLPGLDTGLAA